MSCKDTIHLICWYLEGKLSPGVATEIEKHVKDCSNCQLVMNAATSTLDHYFGSNRGTEAGPATQAA